MWRATKKGAIKMQAIEFDGKRRDPEPYDPEKLEQLLEEKNVREVRVFHLKKGMRINIGNIQYKVVAVRSNGKITLRPLLKE